MYFYDAMSTRFQRKVEFNIFMTHDPSSRCRRRSNIAFNICKGRSDENNSLQGLHMACRLFGCTPRSCFWTCQRNPFVFLLLSCRSYRSVDGSKPREFSDRACPVFRCRQCIARHTSGFFSIDRSLWASFIKVISIAPN